MFYKINFEIYNSLEKTNNDFIKYYHKNESLLIQSNLASNYNLSFKF